MENSLKTITVAGGCFWGVEEYYKRLIGILETNVCYANGNSDNVTYKEVCTGTTGHAEACWLKYDPSQISLEQILDHLFRIIDPTSLNKQGGDIGTQYRTGIYYHDENDLETIQNFITEKQKSIDKKIVVEVEALSNYVLAEPEHQDYLMMNPTGYCHVNFRLIQREELKPQYIKD